MWSRQSEIKYVLDRTERPHALLMSSAKQQEERITHCKANYVSGLSFLLKEAADDCEYTVSFDLILPMSPDSLTSSESL